MNPPPPTTLFTGKFLKLIQEGPWEYAERTNSTGGAVIAAVTPERKLLLVEQYRIPIHCRTIELPAGIIGDEPGGANEAQVEAARRELIEETGYDAGRIEVLLTGPTSSGLTSELVTILLATELRRVGAGGGVAHENITVHEVSLNEVHEWLVARRRAGLVVDPKIYAGLYFIERRV